MIKTAIQAALDNKVQRPLPKMACVLSNGRNTVVGYNKRKTHPLQLKFNKRTNPKAICLHAEMDAIRQAVRLEASERGRGADLSSYRMYVARVHRSGETACAKPCEGCQSAIISFGIKHVEWTE